MRAALRGGLRRLAGPGRLRRLADARRVWFALCASLVGGTLLLGTPATGAAGHRAVAAKPVPAHRARPATRHSVPLVHVLFVGASITSGLEQTSLEETYPGRVVTALQEQGFRVDWQERARSGATAADALTWPYPSGQQIIVVHVITNDFLHGTPLDVYQGQLHRILAELREGSPKADLVCLGTWEAPGTVNRQQVSLTSYDAAAEQGCAAERGRFVPLDSIFAAPGSRGPMGQATPWGPTDGWHPNDAGAQRIADAVVAAVPKGAGEG